MIIPFQQLDPQTLTAVLESYALREGTEYGEHDISLEKKVEQLQSQLMRQKIFLVFDEFTESIDIQTYNQLPQALKDSLANSVSENSHE